MIGEKKEGANWEGLGGGGYLFCSPYTEGLIGEGGLIEDLRYLQIITWII